jgi:hypothetical protein
MLLHEDAVYITGQIVRSTRAAASSPHGALRFR